VTLLAHIYDILREKKETYIFWHRYYSAEPNSLIKGDVEEGYLYPQKLKEWIII